MKPLSKNMVDIPTNYQIRLGDLIVSGFNHWKKFNNCPTPLSRIKLKFSKLFFENANFSTLVS